MRLRVGTSGFSYKAWNGPFYPADLKPAKMLGYLAERLASVEINNTFYRMPRPAVMQSWAAEVPESFRFAIKASRRITHSQQLADADESVNFLWNALEPLGDRLGPVLFQLPPYFKSDLARLDDFLAGLPDGLQAVFEFRHASWIGPETLSSLAAAGAALCTSDADEQPESEIFKTASHGYLRLRRTSYDERALDRWAERIRSMGWDEAYVFFKHEGLAPQLAQAFQQRFST